VLSCNNFRGKSGQKTKRSYQKIRRTRRPEKLLAVQSSGRVLPITEPLVKTVSVLAVQLTDGLDTVGARRTDGAKISQGD
jgi:hypothetical protein